jgi:ketosteroid isomerase-like protein
MMSERDLLTAAYRAFNARDIDSVLALMEPDVDWPNGWEGGRVHGHDAVRQYWTRQWNAINPHVEPRDFSIAEDGRTVAQIHQVVRDLAGNVIADQIVEHAYTIRNGRIARMDIRNV